MTAALSVQGLSASYGKINALLPCSLTVPAGSIVSIVGPNGAGKSTLLCAIAGLIPSTGVVSLFGEALGAYSTEQRIACGLALVPEKRELFSSMTVEDNLVLGAYLPYKKRLPFRDSLERVFNRFPRLRERRAQFAGTLSGGERQMLAVGRALMSQPKVLLLDEPSLGLSPKVTSDLLAIVKDLKETGVSILLVEQNVRSALRISDCAYVLEGGSITLEGVASTVANDQRVVASYLGMGPNRASQLLN